MGADEAVEQGGREMGEVLDGGDSIAPYYVRRAELYMRLNLATHITVQGLSRVSGVSARTLAYGFSEVSKHIANGLSADNPFGLGAVTAL